MADEVVYEPTSTEETQSTDESTKPVKEEITQQAEEETLPIDDSTPAITVEDLSLPDGVKADDEVVKSFIDTLNSSDLSPAERANALLKMHQEALTAAGEAQTQAFLDMQKEWRERIESDPEMGGPNLEATRARIGKLVAQYGDAEFRQAVDLTGIGNHPAFAKFLDKIARDMTEGGPVSGSPASGKSLAEKLYTTMNKE